tara:strand:+ start:72 stop:398 length:327 start_codon:yes stop_codon:yes gene_type:complete
MQRDHLEDIHDAWNRIREELEQYVLGHTDDDPMLELQFWRKAEGSGFIMEATFAIGGPTVYAVYDSRWDMAKFHHSWGKGSDGRLCTYIHVDGQVLQALAEMAGYYHE